MLDLDDDRAVGQAAGDRHPPGGDRLDRRADRRGEIEPVVEVLVAGAPVAESWLTGELVGPKRWLIRPPSIGQTTRAP